MTFEEIMRAIEGLLSVQRDLQEGQLRMQERQQEMQARQQATDARLDRLTDITERYINASTGVIERLDRNVEELRASNQRLDQSIEELRASNRHQERINDFLLQRENGGEA